MSESTDPRWRKLPTEHPGELVEALRRYFERGGAFEITPQGLSAETVYEAKAGLALLRNVASWSWLEERERFMCPACDEELPEGVREATECEWCGADLGAAGGPRAEQVFVHRGIRRRAVAWVLALHGMNTHGAWQEDVNWMVSRTYGRMVPVAIYKYGVIRPGVLFRFRQCQLARRVAVQLRRLGGEAEGSGFGGKPDVIAHSFGTWLLGHALEENEDLRVGRVILAGCILRPDFDWETLIDRGQVEAVLNHHATRDLPVRLSHYLIPDSGPAGRRGFDGTAARNVPLAAVGHSGFFREDVMPGIFQRVWQPFLTLPEAELDEALEPKSPAERWRPAAWPLRATLPRYLLVAFFSVGVVVAALALALGIPRAIGAVVAGLAWAMTTVRELLPY